MSTDKTAEKIIAKALADHPLEAAENLRTLLEKISAPEGRHMKKILQERVEIRPLQSLQDRQLARGLLLDALIRSNRHFETPDEMYSPNNLCYGLFMEDRLVAACEVLGQGAEAKTINTTYIPQLEPLLLKSFQDTIEAQRDKDR